MKNKINNSTGTNHGHVHSHAVFDNPEMLAKKFDEAERELWQKPDEVIKSFNFQSNAVVIEIGAGTGYFTIRLAKYLKDGKVIALDTSLKMVEYLKKRIQGLGLSNIDVLLSENKGKIHLQEKADLIVSVDAYHHITRRTSYFRDLKRYLKQDGKIVIIDRSPSAPDSPPSEIQTLPEVVKNEMKQAGFKLVKELDFLLPHQFYLAFKQVDSGKK